MEDRARTRGDRFRDRPHFRIESASRLGAGAGVAVLPQNSAGASENCLPATADADSIRNYRNRCCDAVGFFTTLAQDLRHHRNRMERAVAPVAGRRNRRNRSGETSAVTEIRTPKRDIVPGDLAFLSSEDTQAQVDQQTMSATRKYPAVIAFTESDLLDDEARALSPGLHSPP